MMEFIYRSKKIIQNDGIIEFGKSASYYVYKKSLRRGGGAIFAFPYSEELFYSLIGNEKNPIITAKDVDDYPDAQFVADPFLYREEDHWHVFFEVYGPNTPGAIGHAESNDDGSTWDYNQIVLQPDKHCSFPYVFEHNGEYYLLPEMGGASERRLILYKCVDFPVEWEQFGVLLETNEHIGDSIIFQYGKYWWIIHGHQQSGTKAYYNDQLTIEGWRPHRNNPIRSVKDGATRPAGRPLKVKNKLFLFFQDCDAKYGHYLRSYRVNDLNPLEYTDSEIELDASCKPTSMLLDWRGSRMHHLDCQPINDRYVWIVDGTPPLNPIVGSRWSIGMFEGSVPISHDCVDTTF